MTSNAVPPSVTSPSPNEWPSTVYYISGITKDSQATVTCDSHPFTSEDEGITSVMFKQVRGMLPINGLPGLIQKIIDSDNFFVNINTTNFPNYTGSGVIIIITGQPSVQRQGFQYFNTPFQNII